MLEHNQKQQSDYDYRDTFTKHLDIAVVGKDGKYGYINREGVEITPLKYDRAMVFYWGAGRVQLGGKWGLVNRQGEEITPPVYDAMYGHQDPIVRLGDKYGFVSTKTGKLITPLKYDDAEEWTQLLDFENLVSGNNDLARVQLDGKWGCINQRGEEVLPLKYDEIRINQFEHPRFIAKLDGKWGLISEKGEKISEFEYGDIEDFSDGRVRVKKDGKYGFVDSTGVVVIPLVYDDCDSYIPFRNKDKPVWVKRGGKCGYIDYSGKEIIKPKYEVVRPFDFAGRRHLTAAVLGGKAGFINMKGRTVIPFMYEPDFEKQEDYCFNYCSRDFQFKIEFANVKLNGKWGVIDAKNRVILPFVYDEFIERKRGVGFRYAVRDGKKLCIDLKGNERVMIKNPEARTFYDYLRDTQWVDVEKHCKRHAWNGEHELKIYETNFHKLKERQRKSSENIIIIEPLFKFASASVFSTKEDNTTFETFDFAEFLDMEVYVTDNLALTDAEIAILCVKEASRDWDGMPAVEEKREPDMKILDDRTKADDGHIAHYGKERKKINMN